MLNLSRAGDVPAGGSQGASLASEGVSHDAQCDDSFQQFEIVIGETLQITKQRACFLLNPISYYEICHNKDMTFDTSLPPYYSP